MKANHWAQQFLDLAGAAGVTSGSTSYVNGWLESAVLKGKTRFLKSMTFNDSKGLYFLGVDPGKLTQSGHSVILCGGAGRQLRDIFIVPWSAFFSTLAKAAPVNTYARRTYLQYKAHLLDRGSRWELRVQGGSKPIVTVAKWRYTVPGAISAL